MITQLAWKNIWRNKVRSSVILGAIAIGLFAGTYLSAFMNGWMIGTVNSDINTYLAHVQIHDTAFMVNNDLAAFFLKESVEAEILQSESILGASFRLNISGMLASAKNAAGITAKGVFREEEMAVSTLSELIPDSMGGFLSEDARMPAVISRKTAEKLQVRLKSKVVFTFQDVRGDMQSLAFRVGGIFSTTNSMFDESTVFVRYDDVWGYTGLPSGAVHEAGIRVEDLQTCSLVVPRLRAMFPLLSVQSWGEINPTLLMSMEWTSLYGLIVTGIFLLALSFGIVNTMLMAVLERSRELGMLGAIGMSRGRIFRMIMMETLLLTLLGSVVGIIVGAAVIVPSIKSGIDLSFMMEDVFEDYGFGSIVYPIPDVKMFLQILLLVMTAGILSAIYPAMKALKSVK
jgi:ABC-type lipoprotein release transport system permease subunit